MGAAPGHGLRGVGRVNSHLPAAVLIHEDLNVTLPHQILRYVSGQEGLGVLASHVKF